VEGFRLSPQQERLWALAADIGTQGVLRLDGNLDVRRLRQALHAIVCRYDILRTTFHQMPGPGAPVQIVAAQGAVEWREIDLRMGSSKERAAQSESRRLEDLHKPFALADGPMMRASLLRLADSQYTLILTLPALCADAATLQNLVRELRCAYAGESGTDEVIQYVQLAEWLQSLQRSDDAEPGQAYWRAQRSVPPPVLPLQHTRRESAGFVPASCAVSVAPGTAQLLAATERADSFLLGSWLALLGRISGQTLIRAGVTFQGRTYEGLQPAFGPIARVVPVGCARQESMPLRDWAASLADALDEAGDWQEYYERRHDEEPYEAFGFEWIEWPPEEPASGVTFSWIAQQSCAEPFVLRLSCTRAAGEFTARLDYDPQALTAAYAARLAGQLSTLFAAALAEPDTRIECLPILSEDEKQFVIGQSNRTAAAYPRETCLHELFAAQAARTPHRVAVTFGDASLSYDELDRRANQLAHRLRDLNVGPEIRVGIFMHRSLEMTIGLLAVLKAGGAYVPLEPAYPASRLAFMLADAQVPVLLTERGLRERLPASSAAVLCLDDSLNALTAGQPMHAPHSGVCAENLVYALYTSGSTGNPKGALITHRSLVNYLSWCSGAYAVESGTGTAVHSSIGFDATITALFPPLLAGRTVELLREAEGVDELCKAIGRSEGFSLIKITPAHLSLLNESALDGSAAGRTRMLVIGGDALVGARLAAWRRHSPQTRLINEYGPTETVVGCCVHEVSEADLAGETVPMGRPIANTQLYVLDSLLSPLPIGIPGELFIGGDGVCRGYLGRPALTAERFLPDHLSGASGGRLYRTGDRTLRRPDGILTFLGRMDHQVKIRSYRVEPGEIEAQIEQYPGVTQSLVAAYTESSGEKSLVAYVEAPGERAPASDELRSWLLGKLPEHMVPSVFVILHALPLTAHGKVDRSALPDPAAVRAAAGEPFVAPRTPAEETLAAIWRDVLKIERIGIHDDFFRCGGDSILGILSVARAAKAGLRFTTRELFQHPTIAELAAIAATGASVSCHGAVEGTAPLTPIQHWLFERELPEPNHFNQAVLLDVAPELQIDLLNRVLEHLVDHHDALRLRFTHDATGWRQTFGARAGTALVSEVDLTGLPRAEQYATLAAKAEAAQAGLDISNGPLLRALLFRFGGSQPAQLLLVIHHLVVDGVSWRILLEDFASVWQQLVHGRPVQLPPKTSAFQTWASRLMEYAGGAALRAEAEYWLRRPAATEALPVDFDAPDQANTVASTARVTVTLDRRQTASLLHEASGAYRTQIDDLLLTALLRAFARWTGSRSLLVELEGHGREELFDDVDTSRTVGWFTSIFPVHLHLQGEGPAENTKAIKEQLRGVPQRGIGYGILRYLSPDEGLRAQLAALPGPQVSFNYLGRIEGLATEPILGVSAHAPGAEEGPDGLRAYLLDVIGQVTDDRLQLEFVYSTCVHRTSTVERLANDVLSHIESLLAHCLSPAAGGFTASDFPEAGLSQEELDRLVADLD
jgi:amino acid adenylation domain-containing protein/non-ribosomal peptide synthase protein (TIGR01720 family)